MTHDFSTDKSLATTRLIVEACKSAPLTAKQISIVIGMTESTVDKYIPTIRAQRLLHIGGWADLEAGSKRRERKYLAGDKKNASYPHADRKARKAQKLEGVVSQAELDQEEVWEPKRKCPHPVHIRRDWSVSALFGEYQGARA